MQRLWANRPYRGKVKQFLTDASCRREAIRGFVDRYTRRWREARRIARTRDHEAFAARFAEKQRAALLKGRSQ